MGLWFEVEVRGGYVLEDVFRHKQRICRGCSLLHLLLFCYLGCDNIIIIFSG